MCPNNFWSTQITFCKITCGETNQGETWHCGVTKVSITYNMMHYEGVLVSSYYVIAEFASVRIIFGATVSQHYSWYCHVRYRWTFHPVSQAHLNSILWSLLHMYENSFIGQ